MQKVVVTGGLGFVGSHLAEHYAELGDEVVAIDNVSRPSAAANYENTLRILSKFKNFSLVKGDIKDGALLDRTIAGADVILHTAGQVAVTWSMDSPKLDFETNAQGTMNVLEAARKSRSDPKLVFCSTNKVYGDNVNAAEVIERKSRYELPAAQKRGIAEQTSIDQSHHSPYGVSKLAADLYVQEYYHSYGLKSTVFRMSCIYGDRQSGLEDQGWVAWFAMSTLKGAPINIFGDGKQVRDVLYIDDLVKAFDAATKSPRARGQVFNIGGGPDNTMSLLELLDILQRITGRKSECVFHPWRPADQKVYISNIEKAKRHLGWSPTISPETGVRRMVSQMGVRSKPGRVKAAARRFR